MKLLNLMQSAKFSSRKRIPVSSNPQLTTAPGGSDSPILGRSFQIRFSGDFTADHWNLSESDGNVILELGGKMLLAFRTGIADVLKGQGDYSIGINPMLWFWWMVK